mgnify:FL=1
MREKAELMKVFFDFEKDLISFDSVMKYKFKSKEEFFCFSKIALIVV